MSCWNGASRWPAGLRQMHSWALKAIPGTRRKIWRQRRLVRLLHCCSFRGGMTGLSGEWKVTKPWRRLRDELSIKMLTILRAETAEQVQIAREMIVEYATWLEFNLCFQGFEEEMQSLPGKYVPPSGRLLLAMWEGQPAGVIALRARS